MTVKNVEDIYPLTPTQAGMLFHTIKDEGSGLYINQFTCQISGAFSPDIFKTLWEQVIQHYPVLRSAFVWEHLDEPLQVVRQKVALNWVEEDWQSVTKPGFEQQLTDFLNRDRSSKIDLLKAPLMRFALFRTQPDTWQFTWTCHHLLVDGWTMHMVLKNVFEGYKKVSNNMPLSLPASPSFSTYIAWIKNQDQKAAKIYWQLSLENFTTPTSLNSIIHQTNQAGSATQVHHLSVEETSSLTQFAKENRLTLNTLVQAAWALLLSRYSGESDVLYGVTVSGRSPDIPGIETLAGMCINTLPLRVKIPSDLCVKEWLTQLQAEFMALRQYEYSSLTDIHSWSNISRGKAMFESILVFENYPITDTDTSDSIKIENRLFIEKSNFPLAILAIPGEALQFMIIYDCAYYKKETIERLTGHLQTILSKFMRQVSEPVCKLSILTEAERHQLIPENLSESQSRPDSLFVHQQLEAQVLKSPDAQAVIYRDHILTFHELNAESNQLAHYLISLNIQADTPVGIYLERSLEMVVAILAVIKAGGAYVPLDPSYPVDRIAFMMSDSRCPILISHDHLTNQLPHFSGKQICLPQDAETIKKYSIENPTTRISADQLAYLIYTSGSTGNPKGVMVTHHNLRHSTDARIEYYKTPIDRYLLLSSFSFDSSVASIFWTLCQGGTLCIPSQQQYNDPEYLAGIIAEKQISHILTVPSLYSHLLEHFGEKIKSLKTVIVAGETCPQKILSNHKTLLPRAELFNEYGPTEATVWSTVFNCLSEFETVTVPIGKAILGMQLYVLDDNLHPVPQGIPGELYLGGNGITRGYLNQPELTAERFIKNPFDSSGERRLYKTGDLCRRAQDGNLEFLGRSDDQIKLRGFRIEPGEIEAAVLRHQGVQEAVAVLTKTSPTPIIPIENSRYLAEDLSKMDEARAQKLLDEISGMSDAEAIAALPDINEGEVSIARNWEDEHLSIQLKIKNIHFIAPPRESQRQWLISQVFNEFKDDLEYLNKAAKKFVCGTSLEDTEGDISQSRMSRDRIMEDWQIPIMKAMAGKVAESHGDVLEVGFGRGISAGFIQDIGVRSHTIIEMNQACIKEYFEPWHKKHQNENIRLVSGRWQDVLSELSIYDGLFFHAFPMNEKEFVDLVVNSITFAEHFFPVASKLLKKGGIFSYLTTEIDSLSRRHQRALFEYFSEISLSVQPLSIPENTIDAWWAEKMVIIKAVKG